MHYNLVVYSNGQWLTDGPFHEKQDAMERVLGDWQNAIIVLLVEVNGDGTINVTVVE